MNLAHRSLQASQAAVAASQSSDGHLFAAQGCAGADLLLRVLPRLGGRAVFDLYHDAVTNLWVLNVAHD
jgi:hypothetical protein